MIVKKSKARPAPKAVPKPASKLPPKFRKTWGFNPITRVKETERKATRMAPGTDVDE